jgi:prepilin-type N-terminal cleavage/methylation domain-containing protein
MKNNDVRESRGYTLVEILVVIGIISVLAGLVIAGLAPTRERSRETVCISNLHQYGRAFEMYRSDYEGVEAALGSTVTYAQLGMPPKIHSFLKLYKLDSPGTAFCPGYRPSRREAKKKVQRANSYIFQVGDGITLSAKLEGNNAPIAICEYHNSDINVETLPTWTPYRLLFLRLNGQVAAKTRTLKERFRPGW